MSSTELPIYADRECTKRVDSISWDRDVVLKLVTGESVTLKNTAKAGETATAVVYLKNKTKYKFYIVRLEYPDDRLEISVESAIIKPNSVVKLTVRFKVPKKVTPKDVIESGEITVEGWYQYKKG